MTDTLIRVNEEVFKLLEDCKKEHLRHHPDLKDMKLSKNYILKKICEFYLK